jgi:hypothetical protein
LTDFDIHLSLGIVMGLGWKGLVGMWLVMLLRSITTSGLLVKLLLLFFALGMLGEGDCVFDREHARHRPVPAVIFLAQDIGSVNVQGGRVFGFGEEEKDGATSGLEGPSGGPVFFQSIQTDLPALEIDVGVEDGGEEGHSGGAVRVIGGDFDAQFEAEGFINSLNRPCKENEIWEYGYGGSEGASGRGGEMSISLWEGRNSEQDIR